MRTNNLFCSWTWSDCEALWSNPAQSHSRALCHCSEIPQKCIFLHAITACLLSSYQLCLPLLASKIKKEKGIWVVLAPWGEIKPLREHVWGRFVFVPCARCTPYREPVVVSVSFVLSFWLFLILIEVFPETVLLIFLLSFPSSSCPRYFQWTCSPVSEKSSKSSIVVAFVMVMVHLFTCLVSFPPISASVLVFLIVRLASEFYMCCNCYKDANSFLVWWVYVSYRLQLCKMFSISCNSLPCLPWNTGSLQGHRCALLEQSTSPSITSCPRSLRIMLLLLFFRS